MMGRYDKTKAQRKVAAAAAAPATAGAHHKKRHHRLQRDVAIVVESDDVKNEEENNPLPSVEIPEGAVEVHWIPAEAGSVIHIPGTFGTTQYIQLQRDGQILELSPFEQDSELVTSCTMSTTGKRESNDKSNDPS